MEIIKIQQNIIKIKNNFSNSDNISSGNRFNNSKDNNSNGSNGKIASKSPHNQYSKSSNSKENNFICNDNNSKIGMIHLSMEIQILKEFILIILILIDVSSSGNDIIQVIMKILKI